MHSWFWSILFQESIRAKQAREQAKHATVLAALSKADDSARERVAARDAVLRQHADLEQRMDEARSTYASKAADYATRAQPRAGRNMSVSSLEA